MPSFLLSRPNVFLRANAQNETGSSYHHAATCCVLTSKTERCSAELDREVKEIKEADLSESYSCALPFVNVVDTLK